MPAIPRRKTGFFTRVGQALTGRDPDHVEEQRRVLEETIKDLKKQVEAGKISQEELEMRLALLNGEANGAAG